VQAIPARNSTIQVAFFADALGSAAC